MLAAELVDHILSFLQIDEDYASLKTCSLFFPQIADRHLYSHITFYAPDPKEHIPFMSYGHAFYAQRTNSEGTYVVGPTQFSNLLVDRPHIAKCVRVLRIIAGIGSNQPNPGPQEEPTALLPVISSILSDLSQIESIAFSSRLFISWSTLDAVFCTALQNIIRLPSIKQVAISEISGFPLDIFHSCKNLKSLLLYDQCTAGVGASASSYPRLHSLRVSNEPDLSGIIPWMRSNTLHTLSLCIREVDGFSNFLVLINACSASLVSLELDHKYCKPPWNDPFVLSELRLPLLEHIIFRSPVLMPILESFLPVFLPFLGSIRTTSSLSAIRLTLHLQFQPHFHHTGPFVPDWSFITYVLVLPLLRHPIELYIGQYRMDAYGLDVISSLGEHSVLRKMLSDGQLIIKSDEEDTQKANAR